MCLNQITVASYRKCSKTIPSCVSQITIASYRKYSKKIPNCVLAKFRQHFIENIRRHFQILSEPYYSCILPKIIQDNSKLRLSQIRIASYRKYSKTIPNCVLAKLQLNLTENILRQFQVVSAKLQLHLTENILRQFLIVS